MSKIFSWFVKITGYPLEFFFYRKKIYYEDKKHTNRNIKGAAMIISNHTDIYDYPLMMYVFPKRNLHCLVAEVTYDKNKPLTNLLKGLGAIRVDRNNHDFSFMGQTSELLRKNKVVLIYPESRLPLENEVGTLLEFKPSYIYSALETGAPIIPIYTNGIYGKLKKKYKDRARVIIGKKIYVQDLYDSNKSEKENIEYINGYVKNRIIKLKELLKKAKK
ncbi:MAG: 1-acyl-sn-glycerol-3-phosphate acyltransferase [Bacilli bacterium]|nr:1-acyl-sn-glycerol-3-phosphate acyltransferase [Bacilli bacterium]